MVGVNQVGNLEVLFKDLEKWKSIRDAMKSRLNECKKNFNRKINLTVTFEVKGMFLSSRTKQETFSVTPGIAYEVLVETYEREIERISNEIADIEAEIKSYIK